MAKENEDPNAGEDKDIGGDSIINSIFNLENESPDKDKGETNGGDDKDPPGGGGGGEPNPEPKDKGGGSDDEDLEDKDKIPSAPLSQMVKTLPGEEDNPDPDKDKDKGGNEDPDPEGKKGGQDDPKVKFKKSEEPPKELPTFEKKPDDKKEDPPATDLTDTDKFIETLSPMEKRNYEVLKLASENHDKHRGVDKDLLEFYKKRKDFMAAERAKDPNVQFDQGNYAYQEFLNQNQPRIDAEEMEFLREEHRDHEADKRFDSKIKSQEERHQAQRQRDKAEPRAQGRIQHFNDDIFKDLVPEDMQKVIDKDGDEVAQQQFAVEYDIVNQVVNNTANHASLLINITEGLTPFDSNDKAHKELFDLIDEEGVKFYEYGQKLERDNKSFLPLKKYNEAVAAGETDKYWTFNSQEILDIFKVKAKTSVEQGIKRETERLEKAGFKRETPQGDPPPKPPAPEKKKSRASEPPPRASVRGDQEQDPSPKGNTVTKLLDL